MHGKHHCAENRALEELEYGLSYSAKPVAASLRDAAKNTLVRAPGVLHIRTFPILRRIASERNKKRNR